MICKGFLIFELAGRQFRFDGDLSGLPAIHQRIDGGTLVRKGPAYQAIQLLPSMDAVILR
jgi:hypothetical protein